MNKIKQSLTHFLNLRPQKPEKTLSIIDQKRLWFSLSLGVALICGILGFLPTMGSQYVVQDDARSHVFWMQRFLDPTLFPHDIIADYFQSIAPPGYSHFYQGISQGGIPPLVFNKFLPVILGLITTGYCFGVCLELLPIPFTGFLATLLLNQNLWLKDDLISATPRAFFYPFFLAFLYFFLRRKILGMVIAAILLGWFYPQGVLISGAILMLDSLFLYRNSAKSPERRQNFLGNLIGILAGILVLLPYGVHSAEFGTVITSSDAKTLPEFWPGGRASFFSNNAWDFWFTGDRSGLLPPEWIFSWGGMPHVLLGMMLPLLLKNSTQFPLAKKVSPKIIILPELALASMGVFFAAHAFLFKLHHPSRYSQHSFRILMAIAAAISLTLILERIFRAFKSPLKLKSLITVFSITLLCYPSLINPFPVTHYVMGKVPLLYEFFAIQPKDTLIASLALEANNLPTFSQRSILVGSEYALPYHQKYYAIIQQRAFDLIQSQYSPNLQQVQNFIKHYGIDFWILDDHALTLDYVIKNHRIRQLNAVAAAAVQANLTQGITPILSKFMDSCSVLEVHQLTVLASECILSIPAKDAENAENADLKVTPKF